jgi:hypothetical protein
MKRPVPVYYDSLRLFAALMFCVSVCGLAGFLISWGIKLYTWSGR